MSGKLVCSITVTAMQACTANTNCSTAILITHTKLRFPNLFPTPILLTSMQMQRHQFPVRKPAVKKIHVRLKIHYGWQIKLFRLKKMVMQMHAVVSRMRWTYAVMNSHYSPVVTLILQHTVFWLTLANYCMGSKPPDVHFRSRSPLNIDSQPYEQIYQQCK